MTTKPLVVLACSGAARAAAAIPSLRRGRGVVALTLDLGDGRDLDDVRERALAAGAVRAHAIDAREELAREFILPALHAGVADRCGARPIVEELGRLLVAKKLVEIARIEQAPAVAHGCRPDDGDRARFEHAVRSLDASLRITAVSAPAAPSATMAGARPGAALPDRPACVELTFDRGVPVAINGVDMTLTELLESIATIAAGHGVARSVVPAAYEALVALVTPAALQRARNESVPAYLDLIDRGAWFTPEREALDAFCATLQPHVTGTVQVELLNGACTVVGRRSPFAMEAARA